MSAIVEWKALERSNSEEAEVSQYVADMSLELRSLCKKQDLNYLAYLLEIVFIEANEQTSRLEGEKASPPA